MKLCAAELRGILRNSSTSSVAVAQLLRRTGEAEYPPSLASGELRKGYSPRLHPRSKLEGYSAKENKKSLSTKKEFKKVIFPLRSPAHKSASAD